MTQEMLFGKGKNSKEPEPLPPGCTVCEGRPWVAGQGWMRELSGMHRCSCPRGVWFQQQDRKRELSRRAR